MVKMDIVPIGQIPVAMDCHTDNLVELYRHCAIMEELCVRLSGIGLAATQVGLPLNLCIVKCGNLFRYFVNCIYDVLSDEFDLVLESCLSIKADNGSLRVFKVPRYKNVRIRGKELIVGSELELQDIDFSPEGLLSIVLQHELDHQFGTKRLISEIGEEYFIWGSSAT